MVFMFYAGVLRSFTSSTAHWNLELGDLYPDIVPVVPM